MLSSRTILLSLLSIACITTVLYYTLFPEGHHILLGKHSPAESVNSMAAASEDAFSKAERFTPEVLLSAPRRGPAIPNPAGELAVYTVSTYSFEAHKKTTEIRTLNIGNGQSQLLSNEEKIKSPGWVSNNEILWLKTDGNGTTLVIGDAGKVGNTYVAGTVSAPVSDIKLKIVDDHRVAVALVAKAKPNGDLFSPDEQVEPRSSAKLYDHVFVRHWDEYVTPNRDAIWHGVLQREQVTSKFSLGELTNVLKNSKLESPIPTFGELDNFDISVAAICFVAKDPDLNPAVNTKSNFYIVRIEGFPDSLTYSAPVKVQVKGIDGASTSPSFSSDGGRAVFLQMRENGYESDKNRLFVVNVKDPDNTTELLKTDDGNGLWDRSPASVTFSSDQQTLLLTAEENGVGKLFRLSLLANEDVSTLPEPLTHKGQVNEFKSLGQATSQLLLSCSNLIDNSFYAILDHEAPNPKIDVVSSLSHNGSYFSLSQDQVSEIWFEGAENHKVHAWVIKPSTFDSEKQYPLAYLIHGGPQGSWTEAWSTRWNPAVFAEQGYVVVSPDPTGSTGYGQKFTDDIKEQWGGRPYQDLVKGFQFIEDHLEFVDMSRAVALGASYGGYMMNWMQGQPLGKKFKALVCHDGSLVLPAQLSSDEQYFPNHDLGSRPPTIEPHAWDKWSPHHYISNWTTPMLVIHNELDYRLPISEGLAMFNILQERGVHSRFLSFPNENHWVLGEENSLVWHTVVLNFINSFVSLPPYKDEKALGVIVQN
ncbi:uncharacterized protein KY384_008381 [Bacidia gigantensis]|uniref:uncharacterized protein n=1 Tax=Bacidia gigantensis TaxID=2732470 RepID=UPI001D05B50C|nr:uncharacterized protein KY384_008381 [Bacidia gigantensis]KAG8526952.1 hypothetical protein KY384_008381 [Bacidia gigantensis]